MRRVMNYSVGLALMLSMGMADAAAPDPVAGREKATACFSCHGETGNAESPAFPKLAGQYQDYLVKSLEAYADGSRQNAIMQGFAAALSEQDRKDIAAYFASQKGLVVKRYE